MKRDRIQLYLIVLLVGGLLAGCTAGTVEDVVPEESRPVELHFSKPDLGTPVLLSRAGEEAVVPAASATPLPEGVTVRICGYLRGEDKGPSDGCSAGSWQLPHRAVGYRQRPTAGLY